MIAKRITRTSGDDFGRLARYLAAAGDDGEKLDRLWLAGCDAGPEGRLPLTSTHHHPGRKRHLTGSEDQHPLPQPGYQMICQDPGSEADLPL